MKGNPEQPQCGYSRGVCQIFDMHGVKIDKSVNVLEDNAVREGVKEYSDWPTIPQVYRKLILKDLKPTFLVTDRLIFFIFLS